MLCQWLKQQTVLVAAYVVTNVALTTGLVEQRIDGEPISSGFLK